MQLTVFGKTYDYDSIQKEFESLEGNAKEIKEKIDQTENQISDAGQSGCVRKPPMGFMGPRPDLKKFYELQKKVLEDMHRRALKPKTAQPKC